MAPGNPPARGHHHPVTVITVVTHHREKEKMNLDRAIADLKNARTDLLRQLDRVNDALAILEPSKELRAKPVGEQTREQVMALLDGGKEMTAGELAKKIGVHSSWIYRILAKEVTEGRVVRRSINNINHFRLPREEMRVVAGEGVLDHKVEGGN